MSFERLINIIKDHPVLYNTSLNEYRNYELKNNVWEEISEKLNEPVESLKSKWGRLRNCYTNALKRRQKRALDTPWRFENQMRFLKPHLKHKFRKKHLRPLEVKVLKEESLFVEESDPFERPLSVPSMGSEDSNRSRTSSINEDKTENHTHSILREVFKMMKSANDSSNEMEYKRGLELDENDHFFLSMSKRIKNLPYSEQVEVKFQIHKLVYEADIRLTTDN